MPPTPFIYVSRSHVTVFCVCCCCGVCVCVCVCVCVYVRSVECVCGVFFLGLRDVPRHRRPLGAGCFLFEVSRALEAQASSSRDKR